MSNWVECPCCGFWKCPPGERACDPCYREAMHRLGIWFDSEFVELVGRHADDAHWMVPGLIATWTRYGTRRRFYQGEQEAA